MQPSGDDVRAALLAHGWRQGSIVRSDALPPPFRDSVAAMVPTATHWFVLTQDCDLLSGSLEKEPCCELLGFKFISKPDGNLTKGKNPRHIHFQLVGAGGVAYADASVHSRVLAERSMLVECAVDKQFTATTNTVRVVTNWIARRYTRSAFPDALNARLQTASQGIRDLLKQHGDVVSGIWLYLSTEDELSESEPYEVTIYVAMAVEDYEVAAKRDRGQLVVNALDLAFANCPGVQVSAAELRSEAQMSLADLAYLRHWDGFDYLSAGD